MFLGRVARICVYTELLASNVHDIQYLVVDAVDRWSRTYHGEEIHTHPYCT